MLFEILNISAAFHFFNMPFNSISLAAAGAGNFKKNNPGDALYRKSVSILLFIMPCQSFGYIIAGAGVIPVQLFGKRM
jgi:hypothetical protein